MRANDDDPPIDDEPPFGAFPDERGTDLTGTPYSDALRELQARAATQSEEEALGHSGRRKERAMSRTRTPKQGAFLAHVTDNPVRPDTAEGDLFDAFNAAAVAYGFSNRADFLLRIIERGHACLITREEWEDYQDWRTARDEHYADALAEEEGEG